MAEKTIVVLSSTIDALNSMTPTPTPVTTDSVKEGLTATTSTLDSFLQLIGLVFLLLIILVAAYFTSRFVGNMKLGQLKNSNFKVVDAYRISPNKMLQIVKIANKYVVIAIGKDTIEYITEVDEAEVYIKDPQDGEKLSFKQVFEKLKNNKE